MSDLPRVTDILKGAGLVDERWFSDHARDVGTALHVAAHYLDEGDLLWESVGPEVVGRLRQYQRFRDEMNTEILSIEEAVENRTLQYRGTLDRRMIINDREWIVDFKGPGVFAWQPIQLAAYAGCFPRMATLKRGTLHLSDDSYRLREHTDRTDWEVWKAALTLASWKRSKNGEYRVV